jgi:LacI family transcriptional regulator
VRFVIRHDRSAASAPKPTIVAVAKRARVAISTVSRALNGGRCSDAVRSRVQRAIDELGYVPSVAAQSLVTGRAGCIGLAVNSTQSPWFSQIVLGVEEALAPSRKSVLLASMMLSGRYDPSVVASWIRERRIDGLILVRYSRRDHALFEAARRTGLPVVLIAPDLAAPADFTVRSDNLGAGRLVAEHLALLGHRRVGFAGGPRASLDMRQRLQGLTEGLLARGIGMRPGDRWFGSTFSAEAGIEYARRFLAETRAQRPSAVVLGNDVMALGFMRAVLQHGVRVPRQLSVVGFDGVSDGALSWPGLTTVVQSTRAMAADACRVLLERVRQHGDGRARTAEYAVELLVRESTARAPRR